MAYGEDYELEGYFGFGYGSFFNDGLEDYDESDYYDYEDDEDGDDESVPSLSECSGACACTTAKTTASPGEPSGGYECEFVSEIPNALQCLICTFVARQAQQVDCCGKVFCKSCLSKLKESHTRKCPNCRKKDWKSFPDKKSDRDIQSLKAKCKNQNHGCKWEGELRDLEGHVSKCTNEQVSCRYQTIGCKAKVAKADLHSHEESCTAQHLTMAMKKLDLLAQQVKTLETKGAGISVSAILPPVVLKMPQFKHHLDSKLSWESPPFYTHAKGYKLYLFVRITVVERYGQCVSVRVCLMHGEHDKDLMWPFRGVVHFQLLNQSSDTAHVKGEAKFLEKRLSPKNRRVNAAQGKNADGWEVTFQLSSTGSATYLLGDCVYFKIDSVDVASGNKPWLI